MTSACSPEPFEPAAARTANQGQALRVAAEDAASLDRPCTRRRRDLAVGTEECSRRGSNQRIDRKFKPLVLGQNQTGVDSLTLGPGQTSAIPPFTLGGAPVPVAGLNTSYGLYIEGQTAVSPAQVYGPGTVSLMLDPTNNDGTPSTT